MTGTLFYLCLIVLFVGGADRAPAAPPLSFENALEGLMQNHETWNLEKTRLEALRKQNTRFDFLLLPELNLVGSHRSDQRLTRSTGIILNPDQLKTEQSIGLALNWNLFRGGADRAAQVAADLEVERQASRVLDSFLTAEQESTTQLFRYLQLAQEKKAYERVTERAVELLGAAAERARQGSITSEQRDRHTLEVRMAQSRLADASVHYRSAQGRLKGLLGATSIAERWPWKEALSHCQYPCGLGDFSENARPDVRAAEHAIDLAEERSKQARGNFLGALDLNLSLNYTNLVTDQRKGTEWGGQLLYRLPLFDGLENVSNYRAALENRKGAQIQTSLLKRRTRSDWESALSGFKEALQTARERERDRELVERILESEGRRYRKGNIALEELGQTLDRSMNILVASARAWAGVHQQVVALCHSTGRKVADCVPRLSRAEPVGQTVETLAPVPVEPDEEEENP